MRMMTATHGPLAALADDISETRWIADGFDRLLAAVPTRACVVEARRPFRDEGADRDRFYFVRSGLLSQFRLDGGTKRHIVALRFPGEAILPADRSAPYGLLAIARTELAVADRDAFEGAVLDDPQLQRFIWRYLQRDSAIRHEWMLNRGRRDATERVAHLLCEIVARSTGGAERPDFDSPFTQQHIAEMTGQTSVNVNRVLADLERRGLIGRRGRAMTFDDWTGLKRLAGFSAHYLS